MTKQELRSAIERTIEEARLFERENPNDPGIIAINDHRANLEAQLDMYPYIHPSPLRAVASLLMFPVSIALTPVILAGGLVYLGGRLAYEKIRDHYSQQKRAP